MTRTERTALRKKYPPEKLKALRKLFDQDVTDWTPVLKQMDLDIQCISTDKGDGSVAGPWPEAEWNARTKGEYKRPCLHEDVLTQYGNQVANQMELNPMGVEAQPLGEGADEKTAEFLEGRIRNIEYEERASIAYLKASENAIFASVGYWKLETASRGDGSQKVCIEEIQDPKTVIPGFFKKAAGLDMRRCWELERMSHEEYRDRYPDAAIKTFDGALRTDASAWLDDHSVQVAVLWHLLEDGRELLTIDSPEGRVEAYADEFADGTRAFDGEIVERKTKKRQIVLKTILNGVEVLDETEWIDPGDGEAYPPEIPVIIVTGRIRYEKGQRVIESLVRKGRVGQLLYDSCISTIQEVLALTPKVKRSGPEGTFDTSSNWNPRSVTPYVEWKPVVDPESGQTLPPPVMELYEPPIQALELAKQSILIGIQNAIGMSSTERKDRTAKSGKALEKLAQDMSVSTAHYFGALRVAQERQYRILQRILPILERDQKQLSIRDKFGRHEMVPPMYSGQHVIAVGTGKLYQTLQEKQEETASELMKIGDPNVLLAVLPGALKMRGIGEYGDELARMIESIQPPQMQAAREKKEIPPEAMQAVQQANEALQGLNSYAKQLEQKIIELQDKIDAKVIENQAKKEISDADNETKIRLEQMKIDAQLELKRLELLIATTRQTYTPKQVEVGEVQPGEFV